jgi:hypothetical protein
MTTFLRKSSGDWTSDSTSGVCNGDIENGKLAQFYAGFDIIWQL